MNNCHIFVRSTLLLLSVILISHLTAQQEVYKDTPFLQDQSEIYRLESKYNINPITVSADRNNRIQVLSTVGILQPSGNGLVPDRHYAFMEDLSIMDLVNFEDHFYYLTDKAIFSNAWAGRIYVDHTLADAQFMAVSTGPCFLIASDHELTYFEEMEESWSGEVSGEILDLDFDTASQKFLVTSSDGLYLMSPENQSFEQVVAGSNFTCTTPSMEGLVLIGTRDGILQYDPSTNTSSLQQQLPWTEITCLTEINGKIWAGTTRGAFSMDEDGGFSYYASQRWLADDHVIDIQPGPGNDVLILTQSGLSIIRFDLITLYDKALHFEDQVRKTHIRHGFNSAEFEMRIPGDLTTGSVVDSDNDGLWTSMYLASQLFRYHVTGSEEAYANAIESFEAMERLNDINPIKGFLSRSYERRSYAKHDKDAWHKAENPQWDWKGTTSSDEAIGHYFAFCLIAEIIPDEDIRQRAIQLIVDITDHILDHDLYLVDIDGQPTRWARWNPDYVNGFPKGVGDRKLNSSNITGFLQAAYHFTGDEKYKEAAYHLFEEYGYLENLMMPMEEVGTREDDQLSAMLSESWNHSDDEMYFLSYWYLYPYAFTPELKEKYRETIKNHWNIERPEKDGLWNFCYAMTGAEKFDLKESVWYLQQFPMDMIDYSIKNSHRKDIKLLPPNFRNQTTEVVLPPDEKPIYKHNTNTFIIDRNGGARRESSGDIFLLPYWMGRYLGVISAPQE